MENIFEKVKAFILEDVNALLPKLEDDVKMPLITEKNVVFGLVDVTKLSSKITVSILPTEQRNDEGTISDYSQETDVTVTFICTSDNIQTLVKRMCRYAQALKVAVRNSPTLKKRVYNAEFIKMIPHYDEGTVSGQLTASEIELTIKTSGIN